ncbi:MAG: V-type ATP synthase subunit E family protein [Oscillospiraceae bacterium]
MTGLDSIVAEIRQAAEAAAKNETAEAEKQAKTLLDEARKTGEKNVAAILKDGELRKADILDRARSAAQLETRKKQLFSKQELITKTIAAAKEKLLHTDDTAYFEILLKLAAKYATEEPGEMCLGTRDLQRLPKDFAERAAKIGAITVSEKPCEIKNGFLLIYGGIDVNCTFDALFASAADELQDEVATILFSQQ